MKPLSLFIFTTLIITSLFSCSSNDENNKQAVKPVVAEQYASRLSDSREYSSPIDKIYNDLLKKDSDLHNLNMAIISFKDTKYDSLKNYRLFNGESTDYYAAGKIAAKEITDSTLKKSVLQILALSEQQYKSKTKAFNETVLSIARHDTSIQNYNTTLKIAATLAVLEKYQNSNLSKFQNVKRLDSAAAALDAKTKAMAEAHIKKLKK